MVNQVAKVYFFILEVLNESTHLKIKWTQVRVLNPFGQGVRFNWRDPRLVYVLYEHESEPIYFPPPFTGESCA